MIHGFVLAINNLSGILAGNYFLINYLGNWVLAGICSLLTVGCFFFLLWKRSATRKVLIRKVKSAIIWIVIFGIIEVGYGVLGIIIKNID